jgi:hypothetical protein
MEDPNASPLLRLDATVYRFKLDPAIVDAIAVFAKTHRDVDRRTFQSRWREWLGDNQSNVNRESNRLTQLGFRGSPVDKMYKSARYYFRNKSDPSENPPFPARPKQQSKRRYVPSSGQLRQAMDAHIENHIRDRDYTPANGFDHFCQTHVEVLRVEIGGLRTKGEANSVAIAAKMKKTYKNRYYQIARSS